MLGNQNCTPYPIVRINRVRVNEVPLLYSEQKVNKFQNYPRNVVSMVIIYFQKHVINICRCL